MVKYPVTAVPAGNGIGKSRVGSSIILWFALLHPNSRVVVAAPTNAQLSGVLWGEVTGAYRSAERNGRYLGGKFEGLSLSFGENWLIEGWGQGSVESKSGRHAGKLLAVIDEASGVKPQVLEAIDSLNPSHRLYLGNPLRPEGKFYETATRSDPRINVITIPSLESPHATWVRSPWGLADRTWLELSRSEYGEDSLWWRSHVLAQFPDEISQALLPASWLAGAAQILHVRAGPVRLTVDLALGNDGDETCLMVRDDNGIFEAESSNKWSLEVTAERASVLVKQYGIRGEHVVFDSGGVGADFDNRLRAKGILGAKGYLGNRPGGERFFNLRSAAGWAFRRRLDPNRSLRLPDPADKHSVRQGTALWEPDLQASPSTPSEPLYVPQKPFAIPAHLLTRYRAELQGIRYELDDHGRIALELKEVFVARLKRSPNFLDTCLMSFAYPHS